MSRYIDAEEFADFIKRWGQGSSLEDVIEWLQTGESADVVEVVRCKDCKHRISITGKGASHWHGCLWRGSCEDNGFCNYGERKEA